MIDIQLTGLVKEFEVGQKILDEFTLKVDEGERVGLLGKNGAGKTTIFRIMTGQVDPDEGTVVIAPGKRMGLISQIPVYPEGFTVHDVLDTAFARLHAIEQDMAELAANMADNSSPEILARYDKLTETFETGGGYDTETRLNKVCNGLSIDADMRNRLFCALSGGEKTRINLARLILEDTDILLLDEPTNHLDLNATEWLEEYLERFKGTVMAISHDRWFLDKLATSIFEVRDGGEIFHCVGNWSDWSELRQEEEKAEAAPAEKPRTAAEKPREKKLKFTFKEQKEFETIDDDIAALEEEIAACEAEMSACGSDYVRLQQLTERQEELNRQLEEKTERWVYLNELKERIDAQG